MDTHGGGVTTIVKYLEDLVKTPSPTGMTQEVEAYLMRWAAERDVDVKHTHKGAVVMSFTAAGKTPEAVPLILAAHVDTLGAMVKEVKGDALDIVPVGAYPPIYILGNECTIHARGDGLTGTILPKNPAVHVNAKLRELAPKFEDLQIRVDWTPEGEAKLTDRVAPGDFVSLDPEFSRRAGFVKTRHLDDKASAAVLLALAEELASDAPARDVHLFLNVTEETGQGLAVIPDVADLVVVDMGVVGDGCQGKETAVSICAMDSSGPYNAALTAELRQVAEENAIDHVMDIFPHYGSDGSAALAAGKDYRVALIGPGVNASHGWERTHESALDATLKLLKLYIDRQK